MKPPNQVTPDEAKDYLLYKGGEKDVIRDLDYNELYETYTLVWAAYMQEQYRKEHPLPPLCERCNQPLPQ